MPFGVKATEDRPHKTWQAAEKDLEVLGDTSWEMGVRCVQEAPDGEAYIVIDPATGEEAKTRSLWQPFVRSYDLPYDVLFASPMTEEMAIRAAIAHGKKAGAEMLSEVKEGKA